MVRDRRCGGAIKADGPSAYSFASGTGTATISDPGGLNTILLGTGLTSVTLYGSGNDLLITDGVSGDKIDVLGQLNTPAVQTLHYSSGSTLNLANGLTLNEVAGGTVLNGTAGSDTLFGNTGSQTLNGNGGDDMPEDFPWWIAAGGIAGSRYGAHF